MKDTKHTYPELYYSEKIKKALTATPNLPVKPIEPTPPPKPINPGEYDSGGNRGCFFVAVIASIILFLVVISADEVKFQLVLCSIVLFLITLFLFKTTTWDKESHEKKEQEYNKLTRDYPHLLKKYEEDMTKYQNDMSLYNKKVRFLLSSKNIELFRAKQIKLIVDSPNFIDCDENDIVKIGVSENYFVQCLKSNTNLKIYTNKKVSVGSKYYYPDIICEINGLYFDIEIDEPYTGNDGTPIHYLEEKYGILSESVDSKRNEYMVKKGWNIIRFSEEQIFLHTQECIDYISNVVDSIIGGTEIVEIPDYFITEKWNKEQSHKMSYKRFRRTYVPPKYHSNIDKEEYCSYSEIKKEIFASDDKDILDDDYLPF